MALQPSFPGPSGLADSLAIRKDLAGLVVRDSAGVVRGGVFPRHTSALITARSDMRVNVLAFDGVTVRSGPSFIANDGTITSPLLATAPSSNARLDLIYFKQNESSLADADNLPFIGVVTGTASADPQKPALLIAGAEELGTVYVPSTAVATNSSGVVFTASHRFTAAAGGQILFRTVAERDDFAGVIGQPGFVLADSAECVRTAAGWRRTTPRSGVATFATDGSGLGYITHGMGYAPTSVQLSQGLVNDTVGPLWMIAVGAITSTQIQVVSYRNDSLARLSGTTVVVHWEAQP